MRGIYITKQSGDKVTGHYLSFKRGRWIVHLFTSCHLDWIMEQASHVIHEPAVYKLQPVTLDLPSECGPDRASVWVRTGLRLGRGRVSPNVTACHRMSWV